MAQVSIVVNGKVRKAHVEPRLLLVHFLREQLNLTGTYVGCDTSQCGACTVLVDGRSAKACTIFAVQADGSEITTVEGPGRGWPTPSLAGRLLGRAWAAVRLLHARHAHGRPWSFLNDNPKPTEHEIREGIAGHFMSLHRLPAHRQRHPARIDRGGDPWPCLPCCRSLWVSASSGARIRA